MGQQGQDSTSKRPPPDSIGGGGVSPAVACGTLLHPHPWRGLSHHPLGHRLLQGALPGVPGRNSYSVGPSSAPGDPAHLSLNPWGGDWVSALAEGPALMADMRWGLGNMCRG